MISTQDILSIKSTAEGKEILQDDELEQLKAKRRESITNQIKLAELVINSYYVLSNNLLLFNNEQLNNYMKEIQEKVEKLKSLISDYDYGESIGDYYIEQKIKSLIKENLEVYQNLTNVFFTIFEEE